MTYVMQCLGLIYLDLEQQFFT